MWHIYDLLTLRIVSRSVSISVVWISSSTRTAELKIWCCQFVVVPFSLWNAILCDFVGHLKCSFVLWQEASFANASEASEIWFVVKFNQVRCQILIFDIPSEFAFLHQRRQSQSSRTCCRQYPWQTWHCLPTSSSWGWLGFNTFCKSSSGYFKAVMHSNHLKVKSQALSLL